MSTIYSWLKEHFKCHEDSNMAPSLKITQKHHKHLNNPFPSKPRTLPHVKGSLVYNPKTLSREQVYEIGHDFHLRWSPSNGGFVSISHGSRPSEPIWSTVPGRAFVSAAAVDAEIEESRGSFLIRDGEIHLACNHQTIDRIRIVQESDIEKDPIFYEIHPGKIQSQVLLIEGKIFSTKQRNRIVSSTNESLLDDQLEKKSNTYAKYWMVFHQENRNQVGFQVRLGKICRVAQKLSPRNYSHYKQGFMRKAGRVRIFRATGWCGSFPRKRLSSKMVSPAAREEEEDENVVMKGVTFPDFNRIFVTYSSEESERFFGFGEQFSHMDFKGRKVPIFVQEQGIGRGDQPITFAANFISYRSGGDESTTYAPSPFYMTTKMRSLYLEGHSYSIFDLTKHDSVQIQVHGDSMQGRIINGNSPAELIENFTETIGRPQKLPEWIISGAVVGIQGGTDTVREIWEDLKDKDTPISAFWLQDWVGQRKTVIGSQLWWNWEVDSSRYPGWNQLIEDLREKHIQVMTYCNPCLAPTEEKANARRNLFEEAKKLDILVKDSKGGTYMVPNTAFDVGMLDLTHPRTSSWFKRILREMVDDGVRGWMADFGEGLPLDACLYSGEDPITAHNRYPELWAKLNREVAEEWRITHPEEEEEEEEDLVFFMRAGFRESPRWASLFWEGDQMVSWQRNDGIKSSVVGLLSGGLSGFSFNHSDVGGYCTVSLPFFKYHRSEELLMRWMELNAFTTVFRTHEGNKPSCNSQFYSNERTLSHFSRFAKIYEAWKFYRVQLVKEACEKGLPICRHLFIHYPRDRYVQKLTYEQFLVGTEMLVAPVLDKGKEFVRVYFPVGDEECCWRHIWTGKVYSDRGGSEISVQASIGYPAVFVREGSVVGDTFLRNLRQSNIL